MGIGAGTVAGLAGAAAGGMLSALGLSRATLSAYKPQLPSKTAANRSPEPGSKLWELTFDYNPKELTFSRKAVSTEVPTGGTSGAPQQQFQGPKAANQTFDLFYSRFEPEIFGGAGISTKLEDVANKLLACLEADPSTTDPGKTPTRPLVQFAWGDIVTNHCFIDDVSITWLMFLPGGEPLRMKASVTLSEAPFDKKLTNPTSGGRTNRKTHMLLAGETLATVAFKELNDAGLWRAIAEENGIDDPLRITVGTELLLPSLDGELDVAALGVVAGSSVVVKVDGAALAPELRRNMVEFLLEDSISLPDVLLITYADPQGAYPEGTPFDVGKDIEVTLGAPGSADATYKAVITGISCTYANSAYLFTVRAMDELYRLHSTRITKTWENATMSDVFGQVLDGLGMRKEVKDATTVTYPFITAIEESPYAFLTRLAADNDRILTVKDNTIVLAKRPERAAPIELAAGRSLLDLEVDVSGADLPGKVEVRGWDVQNKQAITTEARVDAPQFEFHSTTAALASAMSSTGNKTIVASPALSSDAELVPIADSLAKATGSGIIEIHGRCMGEPTLRSGSTVKLSNVPTKFAGSYVVTTSRHRFNRAEGYRTEFSVTGDQDRSLLGLTSGGHPTNGASRRGGVLPGIVTANDDPDKMGRVRVAFPWAGTEHDSHWARVAGPMSGSETGFLFLPQIDDEVLCAFEDGDPTRPFVVGSLWNGVDKLPDIGGVVVSGDKVVRRGIVTEKLWFKLQEDSGEVIELGTKDGKFTLLIDAASSTIRIVSEGKLELVAKQDVSMKTDAGIKIEATGKLELKGNGVEIKDTGGAELKLQATAALKGATVAIN